MTTLAKLFLPLLKRFGRWVIRRLSEWGRTRLTARIQKKVAQMRVRLERARTPRRKRWLRFRIAWRTRLLAWISKHSAKLTQKAVDAADAALTRAGHRIPHHHGRDSWGAWDRATAG